MSYSEDQTLFRYWNMCKSQYTSYLYVDALMKKIQKDKK